MNRADLERLDRDALIARAEAAGVTRARILTRPELVDEILLRSTPDEATRARVRGLFGVARDLLARVVERGLHLPDAADRIRTLGALPPPKRGAPAALPTVTLAEIYAAQGHRDRAIETLEGVLSREPDHVAARALLQQLEDASYPLPVPPLPPEPEDGASRGEAPDTEEEGGAGSEPTAMPSSHLAPSHGARPSGEAPPREPAHVLDDAPLPPRYDVDECVAIPVDPRTLYVYWEVRERTLEHIRSARPQGTIALRIVVVVPTWEGPRSSTQDHDVSATVGDFFAVELPPGCVVRAAVGWKSADSFLPIAHSPALETPPGGPSPLVSDVLVRWTPEGASPVLRDDEDAESISRALGRVRRDAARKWRGREGTVVDGAPGTGERWVTPPSSWSG